MREQTPREHRTLWQRVRAIDEIGVIVALLSVCALLWLATGRQFVRTANLLQVARQASSYGIMSVGMVLLLSMGEIDLSVGSILTLVNIVTAVALREDVPMPVAVLAGLTTGAVCGFVNGLLGVLLRIPTIIVTLGTMSIFRGLALVISKATPIGNFSKDNLLFDLGGSNVLGVPTSVLLMCAVGLMGHVLLQTTPFGWRAQAIGSNVQAARFSGIPLSRYRIVAMTIMGFVAGIAGIMELAFLQSGSPTTGQGYELYVIASAIIGGTALAGGSGSVVGGILGALLIAVIRNGLVLLELSAYWGAVVTGAVIIVAVAIGGLVKKQ
ncbi:MAG: ABC transporter permease [Verrucomicrobiales bacterium]|nr:ABC transporter permease [Verrucomicrobiales bacterium]